MVSLARESLTFLQDLGFMNIILPFIFIFVILFGILEKTRVLGIEKGKTKKNMNAMVAFVIAFVFITSVSRVDVLTTYLQILGMGLVAIMTLFYVLGSFQEKVVFTKLNFVNILGFLFVIIAFFYTMGLLNKERYSFIFDLIFNPVVITVIIFYLVVMFITGDSPKKKREKKDNRRNVSSSKKDKPYLRKLPPEEVPEHLKRQPSQVPQQVQPYQ